MGDQRRTDETVTTATTTSRRRTTAPRGRQAEPAAVAEIAALLAGQEPRRDLLIEHLHRIQDRWGRLATRHLAALAEWMRLPLAEVYEVASFYAHFEIVEDDAAPAPPTVRVCDSPACRMAGADELAAALDRDGVRVQRVPCMGRCDSAPTAMFGGNALAPATVAGVEAAIADGRSKAAMPEHANLITYSLHGGYQLLRACLDGRRAPDQVIRLVEDSPLRGLGGAGFPTGRKWRLVRNQPGPRLMAVNADEGEPGTFKDRAYLETDPHRFLEGMLIAAWAADVAEIYIYLRDEYPHIRLMLEKEIAAVVSSGLDGGRPIHLRRGAGAYICGEESAMIESIEGKRGLPRHRPPFVAEKGLFGRPTLVNNVETLYWVRDVIERGPDWLAGYGRRGRSGLRSFSVSGRVREPGVKLAPAGITLRELIDEHCGGMPDGHSLRAFLPGGASGGFLPAALADEPLDFGTLEAHGAFIGSAAVLVLSDHDDLRAVALNLARFFAHESCGQCTPCRAGTAKSVRLLEDPAPDAAALDDLAQVMRDASICGLGQAAPNVWQTLLRHFPEEMG